MSYANSIFSLAKQYLFCLANDKIFVSSPVPFLSANMLTILKSGREGFHNNEDSKVCRESLQGKFSKSFSLFNSKY